MGVLDGKGAIVTGGLRGPYETGRHRAWSRPGPPEWIRGVFYSDDRESGGSGG